jgi:hypothetical protein
MRSKITLLSMLVVVISLGNSGCGHTELPAPRLYPVRGKVTIHGEPARYVTITLQPVPDDGRAEATGTTSHDGTFEISTLSNDGIPDGAMPGEYEVVLVACEATPADLPEGVVPTQFSGEFRTSIVVEVKKEDNDLEIEVP